MEFEIFRREKLQGKRLFEFIGFELDCPNHRGLIDKWKACFENQGVPFVIVRKANSRKHNRNIDLIAMWKAKYAGEMRGTRSLESLMEM